MHDSTGKKHVLLRSASKTVDVRNDLIQYIEQTEALGYKIN
jgi:DNA polymerase-3 subunit alpha